MNALAQRLCRSALRLLPSRLRERVYYCFFHGRHAPWPLLFKSAPLQLCPAVAMHDLAPSDAISGALAFTGLYELDLSHRLAALARSGGTLVDVGANMGYFSLLWAGLREANRVIAFEASPRNVVLLQNNVSRNGLDARVQIVPMAVGDRAGAIHFDPGPADQTGWGGVSRHPTASTIAVPMVRLDEQLAGVEIDVLKIDVEGADTLVLLGAEQLLRRHEVKTVFFEQNPERMERLGLRREVATALLADCGYDCVPLDRDQSEWMATSRAHD